MASHQKQFAKLHAAIKAEDYQKAYSIAHDLAKVVPDDVDVARCLVVSQIHLRRFDEAFVSATKHGFVFEQAYAQYQLGRLDQSLAIIKAAPEPTAPNLRTLEAQILYRIHRPEEVSSNQCFLASRLKSSHVFSHTNRPPTKAVHVYEEIREDAPAEIEVDELATNSLAAFTAAVRRLPGSSL